MDLNSKIEAIKPYQLNCNIFTVYDNCGVTIQELLAQFFAKINSCIDVSNGTIELAKWLVEEGLEIEVAKKLELWLVDGTLGKIINEILLKELEEKVELNEDNISKLQDTTKKLDEEIKTSKEDISKIKIEQKKQDDAILSNSDRIKELEDGGGDGEGDGTLPVSTIYINQKSTMQMVNELQETSTSNNSKNIFRIGSFNIPSYKDKKVWKTTQASYEMLKQMLDICCIQEFVTYYIFESRWWAKIPKAYENLEFNELWSGNGFRAGQAILSKPSLNNTQHRKYTQVSGYEDRGYMRTTINIGNNSVNVYNTHLTHNNMTMLRSEMQQLANIVKNDNAKYKVICGDFNTNTLSDYEPFTSLGYSFAIPLSTRSIDNVLIPQNMSVLHSETIEIDNQISDHNMVIAELQLL